MLPVGTVVAPGVYLDENLKEMAACYKSIEVQRDRGLQVQSTVIKV